MEIFLLRHGSRNFTMGDVPLNSEGLLQAKAIADNSLYTKASTLFCSPKIRARMTIEPLAIKLGLNLQIFEELDQMASHESDSQFKSRVEAFLKKIEDGVFGSSNILICSHSDWLSIAVQIIATDGLDMGYKMFQCAEAMAFKIEDGIWQMTKEEILP